MMSKLNRDSPEDATHGVWFVAFFRNLNQGQRGSPTSKELQSAFGPASSSTAHPFQGNGTVIFAAKNPTSCAEAAAAVLRESTGWNDVVFVRPLKWIVDLVADLKSSEQEPGRTELSLFDESSAVELPLPHAGRRCTIIRSGAGFAVVVNDNDAESNGVPTLERMLETKATSRGLRTLQRLIDQVAACPPAGARFT